MSDLRKAAQQALEALESCGAEAYNYELVLDAENALYAALAQPIISPEIKGDKAEPEQQLTLTFDAFVKQIRDKAIYETIYADTEGRDILVITLLDAYVLMRHTAPPQRKPLTEEEIYKVLLVPQYAIEFVRAIEKAHGIGHD
jgi:hypothetical protein